MIATVAGTGGWSVPIGAPVHDAPGEKIGTLVAADADALVIARGTFFLTEHAVELAAVDRSEGGVLFLSLTTAQGLGEDDADGSTPA